MNSETTEKIEQFFTLNRSKGLQGLPAYWTLNALNKKTPIATNYEESEIEDSLELLDRHLSIHDNVPKMLLKLRTGRTDNTPFEHIFQNPYYVGKQATIGGFSNIGGSNSTMAMIGLIQAQGDKTSELMAQMLKQQADSDRKYQQLKHKQEIKELREEIAGVVEQQKGLIGQILDKAMPLLEQVAPVIINNIMGGGAAPINGIGGAEQPQEQPAEPQQSQDIDIQKLTEGLRLLKTVFLNPEQVVLDMGRAAQNNPKGAISLHEMIKTQADANSK